MAATIARAQGFHKNGRAQNAQITRLGHGEAFASANTWQTFANVLVRANGSGEIEVRQNGKLLHAITFGPEDGS